ncbi:Glutathione-dependent formaldehyde-activating enzyme [Pseudovibrio sp. Ad46]|uniref:GFA family protein n=1 Tax=unclassified Pseudovibrio TaxID=2627060 RepID=UPI0007AE766D|nr:MULTISPECIES: GFA family protein [unclassified Pseudovibrio]KZK94659.1 Glutathione-dependent formaldehyde-activating enzyme [Pseudovibrio sp. Ad46]KZL01054.1 Glutathione-dependent formaldehyde-activating enzyme [Pseudovibrio sp. W74]KZL11120.1 Glutathione-dependent formaldehyde-activating enzyme [Pseudovibrio sp. Ad14]KZL24564.1 Glutathione-dependent formaldehyde-activating enzyme [Pseudovibrio sp. WM33]KZL28485.1 Glutathione-dependent formaldehyde-activating enzyme [Pseudovibrio sp. Ad37]
MESAFTGSCLCGNVQLKSTMKPQITAHCHCDDCRKSSGTGHCTHAALPKEAVEVTGELTFFDKPANSGNVVTRGFCPTCGSAVYSLNSAMTDLIFVRASAVDQPEVIEPQVNVYSSRAPSWDEIDPKLPAFPEMPPQGSREVIEEGVSS